MSLVLNGSGIVSSNIVDGTIVNADVADLAASKLTGALPAISGAALTGIATSRLGNNKIINGDFQVNQKGLAGAVTQVTNTYQTDRAKSYVNGVTATIERLNDQVVNGTYESTLKCIATSTASGRMGHHQLVEHYQKGEVITMTAWVKSNNANARLVVYDGATSTAGSNAHTGGGAWEKLTVTKTQGTGALELNCYVCIMLSSIDNASMTTGDYIETTLIQLELGSVATDFEHRSYGEELALCQRYFELPLFSSTAASRWSGADWTGGVSFAVTKRVIPTITFSGAVRVWGDASYSDAATVSVWDVSAGGLGLRAIGGHASALSVFFSQQTLVIKADAEL